MERGDRVIVGGAEILHREPLLRRFVALAGGQPRIAVLASATAKPEAEFRKLIAWFGEVGVEPGRIELLRVSDFLPGAERGAWEGEELARLARAQGLWILGGDQNRILRLLRGPAGEDSPLLAAIRLRAGSPGAEGGLVLGGTSAGAAVMSDPMIGGGTSFGALALPRAKGAAGTEMSDALYVLPGLGFFPEGMLDQHFDTRSRLGRLLEAALVEDGARRPAFGIAEATALVREGAAGRLSVTGAGAVCVVDPRPARRDLVPTAAGPRLRIRDALLHALTEGDSYRPTEQRFDFGAKEELFPADAAFARELPEASGFLSPYNGLLDFAARMLLDNDPALLFRDPATGRRYVRSLLVEDAPDREGRRRPLAWELRLGRSEGGSAPSRLWYDGRYSFENVAVDIIPLDIEIHRPNSP